MARCMAISELLSGLLCVVLRARKRVASQMILHRPVTTVANSFALQRCGRSYS